MSAELNIYEIILQLVRTDSQFQEEDLSKLLPISTVQKGFGLYNGVLPISFNPHEDYEIDPYEIMINLDDDKERVEQLTQINLDIQKYNEWTAQKSADYEETNIWYAPIKEYQMWQFVVSKAKPAESRESSIDDMITFINNEELYKLKEQLDKQIFVIRFNKTIFEHIRYKIGEAKKYDTWDENNIWYKPNLEFVRWFQLYNIEIDEQNNLDYKGETEIITEESAVVREMEKKDDEFETLKKEYEGINNQLIVTTKKVKTLSRRNKYKLSSFTKDELEKLVDDNRKINGSINFTAAGRAIGYDAKTIKSELNRRKM